MRDTGQPSPWASRMVRGLRFALTMLCEGFTCVGYAYAMIPPYRDDGRRTQDHDTQDRDTQDLDTQDLDTQDLDTQDESEGSPTPSGPAVAWRHPERLVADQPLTPQEAELWADLMKPDRPVARAGAGDVPPVDVEPDRDEKERARNVE